MEMMMEVGTCKGVENYWRHLEFSEAWRDLMFFSIIFQMTSNYNR